MVKIKAIILCAGYATRLYPLTQNQPKALLAVGEKTLIGHIMDKIEQLPEVDEVFVVTNDRFLSNFWSWRETYKPKKTVHLFSDGTKSNEERIGAIGDLQLVLKSKGIENEDILVIAGDNLFDFSLKEFIKQYKAKKAPVVALFDIKERQKAAKKYGVADIAKDGRIVEFQEKPAHPKTSLVATCCYILIKGVSKKLGDYVLQGGKKDNPGDFISWLAQREPVYGFVFTEKWFDIGSFEALEEAYKVYGKNAEAEQ